MKIGTPVADVALNSLSGRRQKTMKYAAAYEAAVAANGLWVPIEFETPKETRYFYNAAKSFKRDSRSGAPLSFLECRQRGLTVFVRCKPSLQVVGA